MAIIYYSIITVSFIGLVIWIDRYLETYRSVNRDPQLDENTYKDVPKNPPFVSILIPARNEEKNIGKCIESLINQDYPNFEIIIINDRSTDKTREIVEGFQKKHDFIRLINNDEFVEGWTGKNYALHKGVKYAKGVWYLFTDADTVHSPRSLTQSINYILNNDVDMLTLLPFLEGNTFWEKLIQPIAGALLLISFPIKYSNNPKKKTYFANGQYILINKDIYKKIGGHQALKQYLLEDIAMSKAVKHNGDKLRVVISPDLYKTRMYKGLKELWNGWSRIFYCIYNKNFFRIFGTIVLFFTFSLLPLILFISCGIYLLTSESFSSRAAWILVITGIQLLFTRLTTIRYYRISRANPYYSFLNPIGCVVMIAILFNSLSNIFSKKGMTWRGTTYSKS